MEFELTLAQLEIIIEDYFNSEFPETKDKYQVVDIITSLNHGETIISVAYIGRN